MNILLTGASGFIGSHLIHRLENSGHVVSLLLRKTNSQNYSKYRTFQYDLSKSNNTLDKAFQNIDVVIHLASKVHDLSNHQSLDEYIEINLHGTQQLLSAAIANKVKRFIFLSTVKVHGDGNLENLTENSLINPEDPYSISKDKSERLIIDTSEKNSIEFVIIRPPLVYGPGVKANFYNLIKLVNKGIPLPFKSIKNQRSMIYVENLCDFIERCVTDYNAKNQVFLVKDYDASISELIKSIAKHSKKNDRLFIFPMSILKILAFIFNRTKQVERLAGNLSIDNSKMNQVMNWKPIYTFDKAIEKTVNWFLQKQRND